MTRVPPAMRTEPGVSLTRAEVEDFLYAEAELLDNWQLEAWLELLTADFTYEIPTTDRPDADLTAVLGFVRDDRERVEARVKRLLSRKAHREFPWSRTRRLITNVRVGAGEPGGDTPVEANFCVWRYRAGAADAFVGRYRYLLRPDGDGGLRIAHKRAELDLETLHPHGTVSILL